MSINECGKVYSRPWGSYETIKMTSNSQTKIITVTPGASLSLQKHFKRSEHWVVIEGSPTITVQYSNSENNDIADININKPFNQNEHVYIPIGAIHRLENKTKDIVKIIEVQIGSYLGEDDIVRFEDVYDRK